MLKNKSNWFRRVTVAVAALSVLGFGAAAPSAAFAANGVHPVPTSNFHPAPTSNYHPAPQANGV